jgi:P-type E1-E2 ATPase
MNPDIVNEILRKYEQISVSVSKQKEKNMSTLFEEIEKELEYIGCSAIEDRLQDGVPETIETLINAHVRVWVLTGDKKV